MPVESGSGHRVHSFLPAIVLNAAVCTKQVESNCLIGFPVLSELRPTGFKCGQHFFIVNYSHGDTFKGRKQFFGYLFPTPLNETTPLLFQPLLVVA